jgi:hypothetical protein
MKRRLVRIGATLVFCTILASGASQISAQKPGGGGGGGGGTGCPSGRFCLCANFTCPVTCDNGCRYINPCVADCVGATNCVLDGPCDP